MKYPKPKIFVSACLEFEKVRYNGQVVPSKIIRDLTKFADFIKVCPEVEIGLGVPREPIRIVKKEDELRLIQHNTNKDVTEEMNKFTKEYLDNLEEIDGFILKEESPSMGKSDIKVYSSIEPGSAVVDWCGGFFGGKIFKRYRGYPIEEAKRLKNKTIRNHFLTKLFFFAGLREAQGEEKISEFIKQNELLIKYYNSGKNIVVESESIWEAVLKIFTRPPTTEAIYEFYYDFVNQVDDKKEYEAILEKYKNNIIDTETIYENTRVLIEDESIIEDRLFDPYPSELIEAAEDDRGRDYWK